MKYGLNIRNWGSGTTSASILAWTREAERLEFSAAMISDHIAITTDVVTQYPAPFYDQFATLAWLAGQTTTIELGTTVTIVPYRSPLLVARLSANIDEMSGGRFILGVGTGWARQEYAALDVPFRRRGARTNEYLAAITELWTKDLATYEGEFVRFLDVQTAPRPVRKPHPPIWVGGDSDAAIRRTVLYGDRWHPIHTPHERLIAGIARLRAAADELGRPVPGIAPRILLNVTDGRVDDPDRLPGVGTVDQVRDDLARIAELGADYVIFDPILDTTAPADHEAELRPLRLLFDS